MKSWPQFESLFKTSFDTKQRKIHFYSEVIKTPNFCSSHSIFDKLKRNYSQSDEIDLNHIDNIIYIKDNVVIFNAEQSLEETTKASKESISRIIGKDK